MSRNIAQLNVASQSPALLHECWVGERDVILTVALGRPGTSDASLRYSVLLG